MKEDARMRLSAIVAEEEDDRDDADLIRRQRIKSAMKRVEVEKEWDEEEEEKMPALEIISQTSVEIDGRPSIAPVLKGGPHEQADRSRSNKRRSKRPSHVSYYRHR